MEIKTNILYIDDNNQNLPLIEKVLNDDFNIVSSDGNSPIVELVMEVQPQIILLDIKLEDKSGYDLCKELRNSDISADIIVIFVSALSTVEDKLVAYASGGDYISKPVDIVGLCHKFKRLEKKIKEKDFLKERITKTSHVALSSMKQASELGLLIEFFKDTLTIWTPDSLFLKISEFFNQFDVHFSLEFRLNEEVLQYPTDKVSTLELEVLSFGKKAKRIVVFGKNILFSSQWCSILVKQLPMDDDGLLGRIRDHFAILLNIIDSRLMFMNTENRRSNMRRKALGSLNEALAADFIEIKQNVLTQEKKLLSLLSELTCYMDKKAYTMGLSSEQEVELMGLFEETKEQFQDVIGPSVLIDNKVENVNRLLIAAEIIKWSIDDEK